MSEKRKQTRIIGQKRDKVKGGRRKLHIGELRFFKHLTKYYQVDIGGTLARTQDRKEAYTKF
jgi:hypothetical protein